MIKQTYLIICILLAICITACQDDINNGNPPSVLDGDRIEVAIATNIPAVTVQTRAAATKPEKQLEHVDVLVFKVEEDGSEVFAYRTTHTNNLSELNYDSDIYIKTTLKMSNDEEKYRIVFIANLKDAVNNLLTGDEGTPWINTEKEELLQKIKVLQTSKWSIEEKPLPMWGETSETTKIDSNTTPGSFGSINLLRSMARIELGVSLDNNENYQTFKISEVKIYHARQEGLAAPFEANYNATTQKVTAPSITDNAAVIEKDVLTYAATDNTVTGIYVNEAVNKKEDGTETATPLFLILKASYNGGEDTYYKVGFYTDNKPVDILRNFTYNLTVTGVSSPGEDNEEDAAKTDPGNLLVAMTDWSDGEMKYVTFNGQYYLAVSESEMLVPKTAGEYSLKVKTNYPGGWQAQIKEGTWMSNLTPVASTKEEESEPLSFTVTENNGTEPREGVITIRCGNQLSLDVNIKQVTEEGISLSIQIEESPGNFVDFDKTILFHSGNHYDITPRRLKVNWTPITEDLIVVFDRTTFEWDEDVTNLTTIYEGGEVYLTLAPAPMLNRPANALDPLNAWFPSEETKIDIQVGGESASKQTVSVKKQHYEVYIDRVEKYKLDGKKHSFKLYSNSPSWVARFIDTGGIREYIDIDSIEGQENPPVGGNNVENGSFKIENGEVIIENAGQFIEFILHEPPAGSSINAEVLIQVTYDDLGKDIVKEYVFRAYYEDDESQFIAGGDANCYMLQPGGKKIQIPVRQANRIPASFGMGEQIKAGDELTACFIWTDHEGGYGKTTNTTDCTVLNMEVKGDGPSAILEVTPGNAEGNAVVGIMKNNEIIWSWHLWVSDFDPNTDTDDRYTFRNYQFLDRNLGALSDDPKSPRSFGLYYQWGRKDPFPSAKASNSREFVPIYNEAGHEIQITSSLRGETLHGSGKHFLKESIRNPLNFITSSEWWCTSDFTTYGNDATKFWSENETSDIANATKGVFDPCPDGWKTVPASTSNASDWYKLFSACTYNSTDHYSNVHNPDFVNLGDWPHIGVIGNNSASIDDTSMGRYWTGNKSGPWDNTGIHFLFSTNSNASHPSVSYSSSSGLPIRCMRRTDEMRLGGGN